MLPVLGLEVRFEKAYLVNAALTGRYDVLSPEEIAEELKPYEHR